MISDPAGTNGPVGSSASSPFVDFSISIPASMSTIPASHVISLSPGSSVVHSVEPFKAASLSALSAPWSCGLKKKPSGRTK